MESVYFSVWSTELLMSICTLKMPVIIKYHIVYHITLQKLSYSLREKREKLFQRLVRSYMVRRCILRKRICASQHVFVWSTGHSNICVPRLVYQSWAVFVTGILAMQYVSLSPEKIAWKAVFWCRDWTNKGYFIPWKKVILVSRYFLFYLSRNLQI